MKTRLIILFLSFCYPLLAQVRKLSPTSKLILPSGYDISGVDWQHTTISKKTSFGGVKFNTFEVTSIDRTGEYKHKETIPYIGGGGSETIISAFCYCDGAPVLVNIDINKGSGGFLSALSDGTETLTSGVFEDYSIWVKRLCYSMEVKIPTLRQEQEAERIYKQATAIPGNTSENRLTKIKFFDQAIKENSNSGKYQYQKGIACYSEGLDLESIICFQNSILLSYKTDSSYYYKGISLNKLNQHKQASVAFDMATRINPNFRSAWFFLGESYMLDGALSDALYSLKKYLAFNTNDGEKAYKSNSYISEILAEKPFRNK